MKKSYMQGINFLHKEIFVLFYLCKLGSCYKYLFFADFSSALKLLSFLSYFNLFLFFKFINCLSHYHLPLLCSSFGGGGGQQTFSPYSCHDLKYSLILICMHFTIYLDEYPCLLQLQSPQGTDYNILHVVS